MNYFLTQKDLNLVTKNSSKYIFREREYLHSQNFKLCQYSLCHQLIQSQRSTPHTSKMKVIIILRHFAARKSWWKNELKQQWWHWETIERATNDSRLFLSTKYYFCTLRLFIGITSNLCYFKDWFNLSLLQILQKLRKYL